VPRLVHLIRASSARTIRRAGIRGGAATVLELAGRRAELARAVFAMPLVPDFSVTYQWVRELRRWHGESMMAVHFVLPSDEEVLVGRYGTAHARVALRDAVRRVLKSPEGNEIVVMRSVRRREVVAIRNVTQLVGWTEVPGPRAKLDCLCQACVPPGTRDLMRRVRGAFSRHLTDARRAKSDREVAAALQRLGVPLERARGRLDADGLLAFARSESADLRREAAALLGYFRWSEVEAELGRLVSDPDERVHASAIDSMVRAGGPTRTFAHLRESDRGLASFIEHLEYGSDVALSARLLSDIASREDPRLRARAAKALARLRREQV
jgi:hypothetical protein